MGGPKYNETPHYNKPSYKKQQRKSYTARSGVYEGGVYSILLPSAVHLEERLTVSQSVT